MDMFTELEKIRKKSHAKRQKAIDTLCILAGMLNFSLYLWVGHHKYSLFMAVFCFVIALWQPKE